LFFNTSIQMKKILVLLLFAMSMTQVLLAQKNKRTNEDLLPQVSIQEYFNYATLDEVFEVFKSKYKMKIEYKKEDIPVDYHFSYGYAYSTAKMGLDIALRNTPLDYIITSEGVIVVFNKQKQIAVKEAEAKVRYIGAATRQNFTLSGIIKDRTNGEPLPFVNVVIKSTTKGSSSNIDGYFTLLNVPSDTSTLEISYIGYNVATVYLTPKTPLSNFLIELEPQSQQLDEVVVKAEREELMRASEKVSMIKLTPAKLQALPSVGEKDIMRAFQLMPGVSAANENSSGLYVRGGTPDQTLVLYDGFNVYHVEHLFGFFSAFNPNAVKDVQLYKGGFEAKFGGRIGSVAEITAKEGNSKQFNTGFDIGLLAANAFVEVPIGDKFTSQFTFRRSWKSPLYNTLFKKFSGEAQATNNNPFGNRFQTTVASYFYDLNGKFTYKPTTKDVLTLSIYNGTDDMDNSRKLNIPNFGGGTGGNNFNLGTTDLTQWGNLGSSFKWSHRFSPTFYMNSLVSYSNYYSERDRSISGSITQSDGTKRDIKNGTLENNDLRDYAAKIDFEWQANKNHKIEFGVQNSTNRVKYSYSQNDTSKIIDRDTEGSTISAFLQDKIQIAKGLSANIGVRANYFTPTSKSYIEPRASMTYEVTPKIKLKAAYGQYNQFAKRVIREDVLSGSRDFWVLADDDKLPVASSTHYIAGGSWENDKWLFDIEGYRKDLTGLTEYSLRVQTNPRQSSFTENYYQGTGKSHGIDVLLQKKYGKLTGWLSYSLAETRYNFPIYGVSDFYANQDVRNEFKAVGIYKLGKIDLSATWIYASGRPYTAPTGGYKVTLLDDSQRDYINVSTKNSLRLPAYHRLDAAATFNWKSEAGAARSLGVSLFNLYGRTNTWYKEYEIQDSQVIETDVNFLGFTPNVSFTWRLR
jgi:ferric enterobactin receptor